MKFSVNHQKKIVESKDSGKYNFEKNKNEFCYVTNVITVNYGVTYECKCVCGLLIVS